jgi:hypothetical protein
MMMRRLLPLLLVFALPAAAALVPGAEKPASVPVPAPTATGETPLAVASDGKDFLVLWSRELFLGEATLYAAKVTETGVVSPMPARRIGRGGAELASLAWTGDAYLAMWTAEPYVMAARIDRDANLLDEPFVVSTGTVHALAWDGRRAVAIANDHLGMKVLVLGPTGHLVRENRVVERVAGDVRLVVAGGRFVLVWTANFRDGVATIYAMKLSPDGDAGTKVKLPFPTSNGVSLDAEADGDEVGIAYTQWPSPSWTELRPLRRYTLNANTLAFVEHAASAAEYGPEVVAAPGGFVSAVIAARGATATLDAIPFESTEPRSTDVETTAAQRPLTASNGRSVLAVWRHASIVGAVFDAALTRKETPAFAVSTSFVAQGKPELGAAGDVALHAWIEATPGSGLVAARVDRHGNALDAPRLIARDESIGIGHDVVFGGRVWLVAYRAAGADPFPRTYVRRVGLDGVPLNEPPLDFDFVAAPSMASNGDVTLLSVVTGRGVYVHRFFAGGTELDPSSIILPGMSTLTVASNGREFLIVDTSLRARRFDASGHPIDAVPFPIAAPTPSTSAIDVASDGTDYFVAFERGGSIFVRRVLRSGAGAEETRIGPGTAPRLAFLGKRGVVAYLSAQGKQLFLAELGGMPRLIAESVQPIEHALASRGDSLWLSYARIVDPQEGISRVFVRAIDDQPPTRRRPSRK